MVHYPAAPGGRGGIAHQAGCRSPHYPITASASTISTAFSFASTWDRAGVAGDADMRALLNDVARRFYVEDRNSVR